MSVGRKLALASAIAMFADLATGYDRRPLRAARSAEVKPATKDRKKARKAQKAARKKNRKK